MDQGGALAVNLLRPHRQDSLGGQLYYHFPTNLQLILLGLQRSNYWPWPQENLFRPTELWRSILV